MVASIDSTGLIETEVAEVFMKWMMGILFAGTIRSTGTLLDTRPHRFVTKKSI